MKHVVDFDISNKFISFWCQAVYNPMHALSAQFVMVIGDRSRICQLIADRRDQGIIPWRGQAYTGWPRKNATPTINKVKKTRGKMKKSCVH